MKKIRFVFLFLLSNLSDILISSISKHAWSFLPWNVLNKAIIGLNIDKLTYDGETALCTTKEGIVFAGPTKRKEFLCGKIFRIMASKAAKNRLKCGDISDAHTALIHNLALRYVTEFSSYPFVGSRTVNLKAGDTFVDIGSFRGYLTCKAALKVGNYGKVVSVEPVPENVFYIELQKIKNNFDNIKIIPSALSVIDADTIDFFRTKNQANATTPVHLSGDINKTTVNNYSTKELAREILLNKPGRVIISITINGTEIEIMESLITLLKDSVQYLEITIPLLYTESRIKQLLQNSFVNGSYTTVKYPWFKVIFSNL